MRLAETLLFSLARYAYRAGHGHSLTERQSLTSAETSAAHRSHETERVLEAAARYGVPIADQDLLDFGCNDGALSIGYLTAGARSVTGVDLEVEAIARGRCRYGGQERFSLLVGTEKIPLADKSVDVIISNDVFEHVANVPQALAECYRVLRPGGKMLIGTWGWGHPYAPHLWETMPVPYAHILFSEATLMRACRRVYLSPWYEPTFFDLDANGQRVEKFLEPRISRRWLNQYYLSDFYRAFAQSPFPLHTVHHIPFGWMPAPLRFLVNVPWVREYCHGLFWAVLEK